MNNDDELQNKKLLTSDEANSSIRSSASLDSVTKNNIPKRLKKTFFCALSLFVLGTILLIIGIEETIRQEEIFNGITFLIIAALVLIPGAFYTYQFFKAKRTDNISNRRDILDEIPEL